MRWSLLSFRGKREAALEIGLRRAASVREGKRWTRTAEKVAADALRRGETLMIRKLGTSDKLLGVKRDFKLNER